MNDMIERVGIIGGGQLGRMLTEEAKPLGFDVTVVENDLDCPAAQAGARVILGAITDTEAITELARKTDVLTWEIEHVPADHLIMLAGEGIDVQPSPYTLEIIQDKLTQKQWLKDLGLPVGYFIDLANDTTQRVGPFMVKSRRGGFDGRGNLVAKSLSDPAINERFDDMPIYAEKMIDFEKEIAVVAVKGRNGQVAMYPVVETIHKDSICHIVMSPADIHDTTRAQANDVAHEVIRNIEGAGVVAIEMFVVDGNVFVNEIAPRVHNSGHHTQEANVTSQFAQHIRAITGNPLGSTDQRSKAAVMINILGKTDQPFQLDGIDKVLALPDTHPHFYGKAPRHQRKIGHITVLGSSLVDIKKIALQAREELKV